MGVTGWEWEWAGPGRGLIRASKPTDTRAEAGPGLSREGAAP